MLPRCENCEIEIRGRITSVHGHTFCCEGCAEGGPCSCDYAEFAGVPQSPDRPIRVVRFIIEAPIF